MLSLLEQYCCMHALANKFSPKCYSRIARGTTITHFKIVRSPYEQCCVWKWGQSALGKGHLVQRWPRNCAFGQIQDRVRRKNQTAYHSGCYRRRRVRVHVCVERQEDNRWPPPKRWHTRVMVSMRKIMVAVYKLMTASCLSTLCMLISVCLQQ